jgi:hypothetical protein
VTASTGTVLTTADTGVGVLCSSHTTTPDLTFNNTPHKMEQGEIPPSRIDPQSTRLSDTATVFFSDEAACLPDVVCHFN